MSCPTNANSSYPIRLTKSDGTALFSNVEDTYDTLRGGSFPIEFNFGPRANPPIFSNKSKALLDDYSLDVPPTIRYAGKTYTLKQGQITQAYNASFLVAADQPKNKADLTLLFKTDPLTVNEPSSQKYIIVSIPLLETERYANDPTYILGLIGSEPNGPYSLDQCLPKVENRTYVAYTTCIDSTPSLNALVMIFYKGCRISKISMDSLAEQLGMTAGTVWNIPLASPGDFNIGLPTSFNEERFSKTIINSLSNTSGNKISEGFQDTSPKTTSLNQYKCVPLDINTNISNGSVQFDPNGNLVPLSDILSERNAILAATVGSSGFSPAQIEGILAGFILVITLLVGLLIISSRYYLTMEIEQYQKMIFNPIIFPLFIAILFSFGGFTLGAAFTRV